MVRAIGKGKASKVPHQRHHQLLLYGPSVLTHLVNQCNEGDGQRDRPPAVSQVARSEKSTTRARTGFDFIVLPLGSRSKHGSAFTEAKTRFQPHALNPGRRRLETVRRLSLGLPGASCGQGALCAAVAEPSKGAHRSKARALLPVK